jgi:large subunit ribosomal protein L34e
MTKPMFRSRKWKRVKVKLPGGRVTVHYRKPKPGIARCRKCGKPLHGIPRLRQTKFKNLPKTKKRPERPYGGVLCSSCMRELMRAAAREV